MRFNASEKCCAYTMNDHMKDDVWSLHSSNSCSGRDGFYPMARINENSRLIQLCKGIERKAEYVVLVLM